jgi:predicted phage terminase large subunit-like protein
MERALITGKWGEEAVSYLKRCADIVPPRPGDSRRSYLDRIQKEWGLVEWVAHTARWRKCDRVIIEAKANGLDAVHELKRIHGREGYGIETTSPETDKVSRALAVQALFSGGLVYAPTREWSEMVILEAEMFPKGRYKDLTDTTTQALRWMRERGMLKRDMELRAEENERAIEPVRRKKLAPLYPSIL